MTDDVSKCCKGCAFRCVGCHGRNPDGTWKCTAWALRQAQEERERQSRRQWHTINRYCRENARRCQIERQRAQRRG